MAQGNSEVPPEGGISMDQMDPVALGAARFINDEFVRMFFGRFFEMQIANSIFGQTIEVREKAREAYKALVAMRDDITRWANGQIAEEERNEIAARIAQLHQETRVN